MKRTTNVKKIVSRRSLITMSMVIAIASVVAMTSASQIPQAKAASLEEIKVSHEVSALVDKVWNIVSDVDNDTKYWSTFKTIKNINKTGNTIEREVIIAAGLQGDAKTHQFVTVNPEQKVIQTNITEGPVKGSRILSLSPSPENNATTDIDVLWNIDMSGIPGIARGFAKDGITKTTEEALDKIAQAAE
jgi:ribosome-associated toxin RatA of RatAB toxin-antitoxin module